MQRFGPALMVACFVLVGCVGGTDDIDVTPDTSTGAAAFELNGLEYERFDGVPTRIGFEPVPLQGGEFPILTSFAFLPDSDEFLAVNRYGKVGHFRLESDRAVMIGSFQVPAVHTEGDCAASSIVLDPGFSSNRIFYVGYCVDKQYSVIKRFTMSAGDFSDSLFTTANVLAAGDEGASVAKNAIGTIAFADGVMWANFGDRTRGVNAQNMTNELGKIARFVPLKQSGEHGYTIVDTNANFSQPPNSSLVYASGFQNPWRGAFDSRGRYWVADVGSSQYEEINVVTAAGENFGWPLAEGPLCREGSCNPFILPVRFWDRSDDHPYVLADPLAKEGSRFRAAWVGLEYVPGAVDPYKGLLTNKMLYGDFYMGFVRGIEVGADGEVLNDEHLGHIDLPVAWQQGRDGYVYAGTMFASYDRGRDAEGDRNLLPQTEQGQLWRVVPLP